MVKRRSRLSKSQDFDRVYRLGRSVASRYLVLYYFPQAGPEESGQRVGRAARRMSRSGLEKPGAAHPTSAGTIARVGFSVSKRLGGAVERNSLKRVLREAYRLSEERIERGYDLVLVARGDLPGLVEQEGLAGVGEKLIEVLKKASLLKGEGGKRT